MLRSKNMNLDKITMGTCYYPEHWDESLWKEDLNRMLHVGIEVIRIGEFAWNKFEPREGEFTFEFFDRFLKVVEETKMKVIFGTPTATPPAWLTTKYPEVLNCTIDAIPYKHGARRHYNYNAPIYQELTKIIVEKIASHYGGHKSIIGWQIDNELNCELDEFYSESDDKAFSIFVQNKYQTLERLNEAWGAVFWNQEYTDWEQVHIPGHVIHNSNNPHQVLDYTRFVSDSACYYAMIQSKILRKYIKKDDFITTNGMFGNLNNHKMTDQSLDFYTYDSYPNFAYCLGEDPKNSKDLNDRKWSRNLSEVRSVSQNFGIMEQQSGANGWNTRMEAPAPKPGQLTLWTMQSVAHGADFISYFRWRTCTIGTEIYWHGILDYSNRDNRKLKEVGQVSEKFKKLGDAVGSKYKASFGVIKDYDNLWDANLDLWHGRVEKSSSQGIFRASQLTHTPMDYVYLLEDTQVEELLTYPVLFYPHAVMLTPKNVELLDKYVNQGGILVVGCRTGYKDIKGHCVMKKLPGLLRDLSRADVVDYTFIGPADDISYVDWDGTMVEAAVFNDIMEPMDGCEVLGRYTNNYYIGEAGLIHNKVGKGSIYYFGGTFTQQSAAIFLEKLGVAYPYEDQIKLPEECELAVRTKGDKEYLFVLNYANKSVDIDVINPMFDVWEEKEVSGKMSLQKYETKVFVRII